MALFRTLPGRLELGHLRLDIKQRVTTKSGSDQAGVVGATPEPSDVDCIQLVKVTSKISCKCLRMDSSERTMLATQADRIEAGARSVMRRVESDQEGFFKLIRSVMTAQVRESRIAIATQEGRLIDGTEKAIDDAELGVNRLLETISQRTEIQLESEWSEIERLAHTVTLKAQGRLDAMALELDQIKTQVGRDTARMVTSAMDDLDRCLSLVESGIISITDDARKAIENFARIIIGLGPQSTLQRGFAIVRDDEDRPLTSREAAIINASFQVEFRDGKIAVKNLESAKEDEK
jgi:exodeoxyribonuclease VII large subunit